MAEARKRVELEGRKAPAFRLQDQDGAWVASKDLAGEPYVLYFYPKASTPGCTTETCDFRDALAASLASDRLPADSAADGCSACAALVALGVPRRLGASLRASASPPSGWRERPARPAVVIEPVVVLCAL